MKIAIDLDGVVFNSDMLFMSMGEIYDCRILKQNSLIYADEARVQEKYRWNNNEICGYFERYACDDRFDIMPCAVEVIRYIVENGNEVVFVSARGQFSKQEIVVAKDKLINSGLNVDKCYWECIDKRSFCLEEKIDVLIDDYYAVCQSLVDTEVVCLYFRMSGKREIALREKLYEVHNWGEIYRIFNNLGIV